MEKAYYNFTTLQTSIHDFVLSSRLCPKYSPNFNGNCRNADDYSSHVEDAYGPRSSTRNSHQVLGVPACSLHV
ncbi:uncharacterized protein EAE98_001682 [Botrytis deweyae]|uniref:Uncharacterized protein n=1 Tax=Botrytis deweyae TaxID=2478750 RepID=A0ABQ7IYI3_9HELO|nr:uncharacterized protein EAE98_001682 [Botrytis deweyae]KAF7937368.1 hypothetical protein EAE98_001682 [Botrytis deweyae]